MIKGFGNMYWKPRETIQSGAVKCSQIWWNLYVSDWLEVFCELVVIGDSYYTLLNQSVLSSMGTHMGCFYLLVFKKGDLKL